MQSPSRLAGTTEAAPKAGGQRQNRRSVGCLQRLYRSPGAARIGNVGDDQVRHGHGGIGVFDRQRDVVTGFAKSALKKLANERVRFDDDDATLRRHGVSSSQAGDPVPRSGCWPASHSRRAVIPQYGAGAGVRDS